MSAYQSPARFFLDQAQRTLCRTDIDRDNQVGTAFGYVQDAIFALDQALIAGPVPLFFWLGRAGEASPSATGRMMPPGDGDEVW